MREEKVQCVVRIGRARIYRRVTTENYVKHYTTKVAVVEDGEIKGLDGFSLTDRYYIAGFLREKGIEVDTYGRYPRRDNAILIVKCGGDYYLPRMSRDVIGDSEARERYYLKPLLRELRIRLDDLTVIDQYGNTWGYHDYEPGFLPNLKPVEYVTEESDMLILVYDMHGREHKISVHGDYYVYLHGDRPLFTGYLRDLVELEAVPPVRGNHRVQSLWRRVLGKEPYIMFTKSQQRLNHIYRELVNNIGRGYDMVAVITYYTGNVLAVDMDIWVRGAITPSTPL